MWRVRNHFWSVRPHEWPFYTHDQGSREKKIDLKASHDHGLGSEDRDHEKSTSLSKKPWSWDIHVLQIGQSLYDEGPMRKSLPFASQWEATFKGHLKITQSQLLNTIVYIFWDPFLAILLWDREE